MLFQIADFDRSAPPQSSMKAAFKARAEVRHYPCDHFDVYAGKPWHDAVVAHQVAFLARVLGPRETRFTGYSAAGRPPQRRRSERSPRGVRSAYVDPY